MITFCILLVLMAIGLAAALTFGAGFFVLFGDLIVCAGILWLLVKLFRRKKK